MRAVTRTKRRMYSKTWNTVLSGIILGAEIQVLEDSISNYA